MHLDVGLQFGRGDLATLTDANVLDAHLKILETLPRMRAAGAGLELVRLVAPERAEDERLFDTLAEYLTFVESLAAEDGASAVLAFSARALRIGRAHTRVGCVWCLGATMPNRDSRRPSTLLVASSSLAKRAADPCSSRARPVRR